MSDPIQIAAGDASPTAAHFRGSVIRCSCVKTGDAAVDLGTVTRTHGYQSDGVNLKSCPVPRAVEDAFSLTWTQSTRHSFVLLLIAFGLGAVAALATHQLLATLPFLLIGATLQVNGGRAVVTNRLRGLGTEPLYLGWGTGAGTTAAADTALFTEALVTMAAGGTDHTTGVSSQATTSTTSDTYQVLGTRTATGAGTVTNAGLFDAASGGNLYLKGDFAGQPLAIGDAIQFTTKVQYT